MEEKKELEEKKKRRKNILSNIATSDKTPEEIIDELYLKGDEDFSILDKDNLKDNDFYKWVKANSDVIMVLQQRGVSKIINEITEGWKDKTTAFRVQLMAPLFVNLNILREEKQKLRDEGLMEGRNFSKFEKIAKLEIKTVPKLRMLLKDIDKRVLGSILGNGGRNITAENVQFNLYENADDVLGGIPEQDSREPAPDFFIKQGLEEVKMEQKNDKETKEKKNKK